jgi:hypothetical protein
MVYYGTETGILQCNILAFDQYIFVGIWEARTVGGANLIYGAEVIRSEKGARGAFNNVISVHVQVQVFFNKSTFFHPEVLADPLNVRRLETGGVVFTAIGAAETVHFCSGFLMKFLLVFKDKILVCLFKEPGIFFLPVLRLFLPIV